MFKSVKVILMLTLVGALVLIVGLINSLEAATKLTFLTHPTLHMAMGKGAVVKEFSEKTGIEVEVVTMPTVQIREKIVIEFLAGTGRYDVMNLSNTIFNTDILKYLEPLDSYVKKDPPEDFDDIMPSLVNGFRHPLPDGPIYGIPFRSGTALLFYLKDLFKKYGVKVPETWDEMKTAAKKLTLDLDGDGKLDVYGMCIKAGDTHTVSEDFLRYLYARGGEILNPEMTESLVNQSLGVETAAFMAWFIHEKVTHPDVLSWIRDDLIVATQQGRVAMAVQFSPYFGRMLDPKESRVIGRIDATILPSSPGVPRGRTYNATWGLFIDKKSQNKEAAWQLIKWLSNKRNQLIMALKYANGPVRTSSFMDKEYQDFLKIADAWQKALAAGKSTPPHPSYSEMEETWGQELIAVFMKKKTPKEAMDATAEKINKLLRR